MKNNMLVKFALKHLLKVSVYIHIITFSIIKSYITYDKACNRGFYQKSAPIGHFPMYTNKKPRDICKICNRAFTQSSSLHVHCIIWHKEKKNIKIQYDWKEF